MSDTFYESRIEIAKLRFLKVPRDVRTCPLVVETESSALLMPNHASQ
jgi:hypothetical protein